MLYKSSYTLSPIIKQLAGLYRRFTIISYYYYI